MEGHPEGVDSHRSPEEQAYIDARLLELRRRHLLNERRERFDLPTLDLTPDEFDFEAFSRDAFFPDLATVDPETDFHDETFED